MIALVKATHSVVFSVMTGCVFYTVYCGATGRRGRGLWVAVGLTLAEGLVWFGFGRRCPLTTWARHLGDPTGNDYIADRLPPHLVPLLVPVLAVAFVIGLGMVGLRAMIGVSQDE